MHDGQNRRILSMMDLAETKARIKEITPERWQELRKKAQEKVMLTVPSEYLGRYRDTKAKEVIGRQIQQVVENEYPGLVYQVKQSVVQKLTDEISGYGPLEKYLDDKEITEIIVERYDKVRIEKDGKLQDTDLKFDSEEHLRLVLERITAPLGRRLDLSSPYVYARLPDGSRVCALIPPLAVDGTQISIRKFKPNISMDDIVNWGTLTPELRNALAACVRGRLSIVVSGGTGSGKTSFLNALSEYINPELSVITIEDTAELQLKHPYVRRWEAKPPNIEGKGEVDINTLVILALRSRPDIIIVGEVRGAEAYALVQALNTGHMGSMTTLHANNSKDAMKRLIAMVASSKQLAKEIVPEYVANGVDMVVHLARNADGRRRLMEISEVIGEENGKIKMRKLVEFKVDSFKENEIEGHWEIINKDFSRIKVLKERGIEFPGWLG